MNARDTARVEAAERSPPAGSKNDLAEDQAADEPLSKDLIFELLRNWRRRQVLRYLDANDGTARLDVLAEEIAARENGIDQQALSSSERKRVYIALYQCHLPKMDDSGVIDYNQARGTIELRQEAAPLFPYLYLDPIHANDEDGFINIIRSKLSPP